MAQILLIEDNDDVGKLFAEALGAVGHDVFHSVSAEGARIRMSRHDFDLVVLDLALVEYDGSILGLELRAMGFRGPIIVVTGGMVMTDATAAEDARFAAVLQKPILPADLVDVVNKNLYKEA